MKFKALIVDKTPEGVLQHRIDTLDANALPQEGDVTIAIEFSSLNYKDGLCLLGQGGLVKTYPHIPGIDCAGTVLESKDPRYRAGDPVILTGWRVGEIWWGGYAEMACVKGDWLVPMPAGLSSQSAMAVGTAGLTAMLAVMALEDHGLKQEQGEVLITGAAGGVGSIAIKVLSKLGYKVVALTGREELTPYLMALGAETILPRHEMLQPGTKPLEKERWAGAIDSVGGTVLARTLAQMRYGASVAAVGLAGGTALNTSVLPFILRNVNLLGIDSVMAPREKRLVAWQRIAQNLGKEAFDLVSQIASLKDLPDLAGSILKGKIKGRVIVDVRK